MKQKFNNISENKNDLLYKIFIFLFFYEINIKNNKENAFIKTEKYYLINIDWINNFKEYYKYKNIFKELYIILENNKKINYNNLDEYIDNIIKFFKSHNLSIFEKSKFSEDLTEKEIESNQNKAYILNCTIMNLINEFINRKYENIPPKKLINLENQNLFLTGNNKIIMGNIKDKPIFYYKYIFCYKSSQILDSEEELLLNNSIEYYINFRKCDINNTNKQFLKGNKDMIFGELIIISNAKHKNNNSNLNINNSIQNLNNNYNRNSSLDKNGDIKFPKEIIMNVSPFQNNNNKAIKKKNNAKIINPEFQNKDKFENSRKILQIIKN